ncbi:UvrD-helicase domain-containing protein [Pseudochrobactrum sp. XF203]|uniref:UvrD-helicase domain-containing protein n=1 Tax=Pseudochrobactrum sp. XF203 TaxID=2879116 RepID=UPI001CE268B8|nr:UvrD-helicase domain-containing protein [Pseudochrobactrum sp. XF203]UCA45435.1 AAA family ATPase [Pseudochrobactrum sp. XF203]
MAICIPPLDALTESSAERKLYEALRSGLGDDFLVLHSVKWIAKPRGAGPRDGEVDFLICHPKHGLLIVEVKGGGVILDYATRRFASIDRHGDEHEITNPFEQAMRGKFAILEKLKESPFWQKLGLGRIPLGHAAFFPDVDGVGGLVGPDAPLDIIGGRQDITLISQWVDRAFTYWAGPGGQGGLSELGAGGVATVQRILARVSTTRPLVSARLVQEEQTRIELTERQAAILDLLSRQRRVMVAGGAGTGKTLIAREKAVRAAEEGLKTLLVCYNRGLADHLREQCEGIEGLDVATFHQLCKRWIDKAKSELGRDLMAEARRDYPGGTEFDHHQPIALAFAIDAFGPNYDAIVVDEAQDFGDEFWLPIEMMLSDHTDGLLYVFLDENQNIYGRSAAIPIKGEPMLLDKNCRNTMTIHAAAYRYYRGARIEAPKITGTEIELLTAPDIDRQARAISGLVTRLVAVEGVAPHDIGILLCDGRARSSFERALAATTIPKSSRWGHLEGYGPGSITVDSVAKFKGLERAIIILWGLDASDPVVDRETLYVGMSRAKSMLFLCGTVAACGRVLDTGVA